MIEKPNKDGKPPTVEYQEEEILVSTEVLIGMLFLFLALCLTLHFCTFFPVGHCLWCSSAAVLQYVQGRFQYLLYVRLLAGSVFLCV